MNIKYTKQELKEAVSELNISDVSKNTLTKDFGLRYSGAFVGYFGLALGIMSFLFSFAGIAALKGGDHHGAPVFFWVGLLIIHCSDTHLKKRKLHDATIELTMKLKNSEPENGESTR